VPAVAWRRRRRRFTRLAQGYFTDIRIDREAIARHGLMIGDVEDVIEAAIGGQNITRTIEGRERYPVNVRYEQGFRDTLPDLQRVLVKTPAGAQIPLAQLAEITLTPGPAMIRDENGQLAGYVTSIRPRPTSEDTSSRRSGRSRRI